ncbi:hypothetical protein ACFSQE_02360 [Vogesella fluminis]|uniref:hypothetical protein n=1 Tax=Vogesella fluminis TaxID=1069161 RepID=UPI00362E0E18
MLWLLTLPLLFTVLLLWALNSGRLKNTPLQARWDELFAGAPDDDAATPAPGDQPATDTPPAGLPWTPHVTPRPPRRSGLQAEDDAGPAASKPPAADSPVTAPAAPPLVELPLAVPRYIRKPALAAAAQADRLPVIGRPKCSTTCRATCSGGRSWPSANAASVACSRTRTARCH